MTSTADRDLGASSTAVAMQPGVFAFELDFAGTLHCIPMSVRLKLDQAGVKLSLKQWNKLPSDARRALVERPCDDISQVEQYRQYLILLIERCTQTAVEHAPVDDAPAWANAAVVPERISAWSSDLGVTAPSRKQWAGLSPLQRFALFKLTRPGHSNDNFIPAMREFLLLP